MSMRELVKEWKDAIAVEDCNWGMLAECGLRNVVGLCDVAVSENACAMIGCKWRSTGRVICMNNIQLCPTIEELLALFGSADRTVLTAVPTYKEVRLSSVAAFVGITKQDARHLIVNGNLSVRRICRNLCGRVESHVRNRGFLLAFTGCHLLPGENGLFSMQVVPVLEQCLNGASIVPLVLGHILHRLDNIWDREVQLAFPVLFAVSYGFMFAMFQYRLSYFSIFF